MTTLEQVGQRLYFRGAPFAAKDRLKSLGAKWDADARCWWIGAAKRLGAETLVADLNAAPAADAPAKSDAPAEDNRVYAKVSYKGRNYFVVADTGTRVRLTVLDGSVHFWADKSACDLVREYKGRDQWDGRRNSGKTVTVYTTLESLCRFVDSQRSAEARGEEVCACGCGVRGELIPDLEDGLLKLPKCCDIPSD